LSAPPNVLHFIQFLGVGYYMVGVMSRGFQIVFWKMSKWGGTQNAVNLDNQILKGDYLVSFHQEVP
jgi:hypothetical protein